MELGRHAVPERVPSDQELMVWVDFRVPFYGNLILVSPQMPRHVEKGEVKNPTHLPVLLLLQLSPLDLPEDLGNESPMALAASKPRLPALICRGKGTNGVLAFCTPIPPPWKPSICPASEGTHLQTTYKVSRDPSDGKTIKPRARRLCPGVNHG